MIRKHFLDRFCAAFVRYSLERHGWTARSCQLLPCILFFQLYSFFSHVLHWIACLFAFVAGCSKSNKTAPLQNFNGHDVFIPCEGCNALLCSVDAWGSWIEENSPQVHCCYFMPYSVKPGRIKACRRLRSQMPPQENMTNERTNTGLISALMLTIVLPMSFESFNDWLEEDYVASQQDVPIVLMWVNVS